MSATKTRITLTAETAERLNDAAAVPPGFITSFMRAFEAGQVVTDMYWEHACEDWDQLTVTLELEDGRPWREVATTVDATEGERPYRDAEAPFSAILGIEPSRFHSERATPVMWREGRMKLRKWLSGGGYWIEDRSGARIGCVMKIRERRWAAIKHAPRLMNDPEKIVIPGVFATRRAAVEAVVAA